MTRNLNQVWLQVGMGPVSNGLSARVYGIYHPFSEDGGRDMVEFSLKLTVVKAYLLGNSNGYAHNVCYSQT